MTRLRQFAACLDDLARPGPEAQRFASMVENNREWFAQLAADNARQRLDDARGNVRETSDA